MAKLGWVSLAPLTVSSSASTPHPRGPARLRDSTTIGRLLRQQRSSLFGSNVASRRQRVITSSIALTPRVGSWIARGIRRFPVSPSRATPTLTSHAYGRRHRGPVPVPAAFSNARQFETGAQLDTRRLAESIFATRLSFTQWLGASPVSTSPTSAQQGPASAARQTPPRWYQFALEDRWLPSGQRRARTSANAEHHAVDGRRGRLAAWPAPERHIRRTPGHRMDPAHRSAGRDP